MWMLLDGGGSKEGIVKLVGKLSGNIENEDDGTAAAAEKQPIALKQYNFPKFHSSGSH